MPDFDGNARTEATGGLNEENGRESSGTGTRESQVHMPDYEAANASPKTIDLTCDPETAEGVYANSVRVIRSSGELILDFIRTIPGTSKARVKSRVIIPPQHAQPLLTALQETTDLDQSDMEASPDLQEDSQSLKESSDSVPTVESELLTATFSRSGDPLHCNDPWSTLLGPPTDPWAHLSDEEQEIAEKAVLKACNGTLVTNQLLSADTSDREEPLPILLNFIPVHEDPDAGPTESRRVTVSGEVLAEPPSWMISQTQRHRMETLGRMTMGVAHDLNNLLSGLLGHIELLKEETKRASLTDSLHPALETIETTAEDGAALINKLQRYIRHDTQKHFEAVDLTEIIEDCITLTEPYWYNEPRRQGIEISVETEFEDTPQILGSASELREVFVNLILNAVQAMPDGGTLRFETFVNEEERVCAKVSDTGTGMSDEVQKNIFEPLFTTKGEQGSGMGLAASYGIIQEHDGTIEVSSEQGVGTRFLLTFPPAEEEVPTAESPMSEPHNPESVNVLVVDDDEMVRSTVTRLLSLNDHKVDCASSGAEALQRLDENPYDIVFTDFGMPEMTGAELAEEIKKEDPNLPVLLLTGYTETETASEKVDGVLSKPFKGDELRAALQKFVSPRKSLTESS